MKTKKCILVLGKMDESLEQVRAALGEELEKHQASIFFVQAKDGVDASLKAENQKFDAVIVDTDVPRLFEGGFVDSIASHKNTCDSGVFVVSLHDRESLPPSLHGASYFHKPYPTQDLLQGLVKSLLRSRPVVSESHYHVDVRVINAVIKATVHVCGQFGLTKMQMQKPETRDLAAPLAGEVAALMPIKSKSFNGALIVSFDKPSYLHMVGAMLGEEPTEITPDIADAIGEITNIIFGNAKADFTQYGVEMATPQILTADAKLPVPPGSARMMVPFVMEKGRCYIEVIAHDS